MRRARERRGGVEDHDVERVLTLTAETTPRDATHWSTRGMAAKAGLSQSTVSRIWRAFALQPHRATTFKLSKDPLFVEKFATSWASTSPRPTRPWCPRMTISGCQWGPSLVS